MQPPQQQPQYPYYPNAPQPQYPQPYYPYQPQMPPRPQPRKKPMPTLLVVGITLAVVLVACCGLGAVVSLFSPTHNNIGAAQATATSDPTDTQGAPGKPAPTDAAIFAPTLGGTKGDFQQQYGAATDSNGLTYEITLAGQDVAIMLALDDANQSLDGQPHIADLQVQAKGGAQWSNTTANTIAKTFLPADATYQKTVTTNGVRDYVYYSKGMAATFTADQFTNNFGDVHVPPGTVNYSCQTVPPATNGYELCDISIGVY